MEETGNESADMKNKLLAKQLQIDKTSASLEKQTACLLYTSSGKESWAKVSRRQHLKKGLYDGHGGRQ